MTAFLKLQNHQHVYGMIEENNRCWREVVWKVEISTETLLKEIKHAVSSEFESEKWYEPIKISIVGNSKYSRFRGKNPKLWFPNKTFLYKNEVFDWNIGGAIGAGSFRKERVEYPEERILKTFLKISNHGDFAAGFTLNDIRHIVLYKSTAFVWDLDGDQQVCSYG